MYQGQPRTVTLTEVEHYTIPSSTSRPHHRSHSNSSGSESKAVYKGRHLSTSSPSLSRGRSRSSSSSSSIKSRSDPASSAKKSRASRGSTTPVLVVFSPLPTISKYIRHARGIQTAKKRCSLGGKDTREPLASRPNVVHWQAVEAMDLEWATYEMEGSGSDPARRIQIPTLPLIDISHFEVTTQQGAQQRTQPTVADVTAQDIEMDESESEPENTR